MEQHPDNKLNRRRNLVFRALLTSIFVISFTLRLTLSLVNREANDDHVEVADRILTTGVLPTKTDCWECFQPKLPAAIWATFYRILGLASLSSQILTAQILNFLAGLLILFIVWAFIDQLPAQNQAMKLLGFGLTALNPKLIAINSQATNDTFVILFSTLALYSAFIHIKDQAKVSFIWAMLFTALAIASKTNGWVTFLAISLVLLLIALVKPVQKTTGVLIALAFLISVPVLSLVNPLNQYISNYRTFGTPILNNIDTLPLPYFFAKTTNDRPGLLSIQDGLFTFKFSELIRHPRVEKRSKPYPRHENSLWTQLYGQGHSASFDNWPPSWRTSGDEGFFLRRLIYYLALLPTGILILGALLESTRLLRGLIEKDVTNQIFNRSPIIIAFWGYMLFVAVYAVAYRDFSVMKVIFIYPAMLAFPLFFFAGAEYLYAKPGEPRWLNPSLVVIIVPLLAAYVLDLATLTVRLYEFLNPVYPG